MSIHNFSSSCIRLVAVLSVFFRLGLVFVIILSGCGSVDEGPYDRGVEADRGDKATWTVPSNEQGTLATLPGDQLIQAVPRTIRDSDWFEDLTAKTGINFAYQDGSEAGFYTTLEPIGGRGKTPRTDR